MLTPSELNKLVLMLNPLDLLLSFIGNRRLQPFPKLLTGTNIAHSGVYIGNGNVWETARDTNARQVALFEYIEQNPYIHVYELITDFKQRVSIPLFIKALEDQKNVQYSVENVIGHFFWMYANKLNFRINKDNSVMGKFLYDENKCTCSQIILKALDRAFLDTNVRDEMYSVLQTDIRGIYPCLFPRISRYRFTILANKDNVYIDQLQDSERAALDKCGRPEHAVTKILKKYE